MLRFGTIGSGWICDEYIHGAKDSGLWELTAVYSRTKERAEEYARRHGAKYAFTNLEEMAASDCIDAVYISSPNALHYEHSKAFLERGKHVICENPCAPRPARCGNCSALPRSMAQCFWRPSCTCTSPSGNCWRTPCSSWGKLAW